MIADRPGSTEGDDAADDRQRAERRPRKEREQGRSAADRGSDRPPSKKSSERDAPLGADLSRSLGLGAPAAGTSPDRDGKGTRGQRATRKSGGGRPGGNPRGGRPAHPRSGQRGDHQQRGDRARGGAGGAGQSSSRVGADRRQGSGANRADRPRREPPTGSRVRAEDVEKDWPEIPEWVDRRDLGAGVLADLRGLSKTGAEFVANHLVAAGALADEDPALAWKHARAARSQAGRIAVVRETVGLVAYRAGQWSEALSELRAARRMAGGPGQLAVMADAERALGHPDRAIEMSRTPEAVLLEPEGRAELQIVVAGARADLGQHEAALVALRDASAAVDPDADFAFRVYYAYAALLQDCGRAEEALPWFVRAADADADGESDASERVDALATNRDMAPGDGEHPAVDRQDTTNTSADTNRRKDSR